MDRPLVIKVGGSLLPHAGEVIGAILTGGRDAIILPGGGVFADAVRNTRLQGTAAHWMAIAGMEQYGWYLSTYGIDVTESLSFSGNPRILLPYQELRHHDPLPHTWEITSDTISAWLASYLSADLLILKSIDQIRAEDIPVDRILTRFDTPDLDPAFIPYVLNHSLSGLIINGRIPERIIKAIQGAPVIGTSFGKIL